MAFEFNNPLLYELREGSALDPFVSLSTTSVIISNKIILSELPSEFEGVSIPGYAESKISSGLIATTFYVNYLNGIVSFASSENGKTVTANFLGRGIIEIPAERIYTKSVDGEATQNLQEVADNIGSASTVLSNLNSSISTGSTLNSSLNSTISTANNIRSELESSTAIALATKESLDEFVNDGTFATQINLLNLKYKALMGVNY